MSARTPQSSAFSNPYSPHPLSAASANNANASAAGAQNQNQPITRSRTLFYLSVRDSAGPSTWSRRRPQQRAGQEYGERNDVGEEEERLIGSGEDDWGGAGVGRGKGKGKAKGLPPKW